MPPDSKGQPAPAINGAPFRFECPVVAFEKADEQADRRRRIGGIISTDSVDQQDERILQDGLDFGYFLDKGWYNDNHKNDSSTDVVGYPESVKQFAKGDTLPNGKPAAHNCTWTEGYLIGEKGKRIWDIANDLQGTGRTLGFSVEGDINKRTGPGGKTIAKATIRHVALTHCHPGDTLVSGPAKAITRRQYVGDLVRIELKSGHKLSATPNHPVLTQLGWVAFGDIQKGHHRIGRVGVHGNGEPSFVDADNKDVPATLEQVFRAADQAVGAHRRKMVKSDFHGDGADGEVDVVPLEGALRESLSSAFLPGAAEGYCITADQLQALLPPHRDAMETYRVVSIATESHAPSLNSDSMFSEAFKDSTAPHFLSIDSCHAGSCESGVDTSPELAEESQVLNDSSVSPYTFLTFEDVVACGRSDFNGYVYSLETDVGWFSANGIASHNCPVNADSSLEVLARSMSAIQAQKALTVGTIPEQRSDTDLPDPKPGATAYGEGAMHVLMPGFAPEQRRRRKKKHRRTEKSLSAAEALHWVHQRIPGIPDSTARKFIDTARRLERRGII